MAYKHEAPYQRQGQMGRGPIDTPPNPLDTQQQFNRFHHIDIQDMTPAELNREWMKIFMSLSLAANPDPWFDERLERLEAEIERTCNPEVGTSSVRLGDFTSRPCLLQRAARLVSEAQYAVTYRDHREDIDE